MKVFAFHVGDTKVPYGQFYGGIGDEWVGWKGIWQVLTDKSHYIIVPIYAYLIDHPQAGLILVDAGINWDMAHAHNQYYDHWLFRLSLDEDEYRLTKDQLLAEHVKRVGYRMEEIKTVIVTHLHEDHLGELHSVPQAKVVLTEDAWNSKNLGIWSYREWSPSFAGVVKTTELINYSSGPFHSFDKSEDPLGDGSIILLPTPGHADGHLSVLVQMDGYQLLFVADTMYTLRHMAVDQVRAIMLGQKQKELQIDSIKRVQQLRQALPETVIVPTHDHTDYMSQHIDPFLADGTLTPEERRAIKRYEARLFDGEWHLTSSALPRFIPAPDGGSVGSVSNP